MTLTIQIQESQRKQKKNQNDNINNKYSQFRKMIYGNIEKNTRKC